MQRNSIISRECNKDRAAHGGRNSKPESIHQLGWRNVGQVRFLRIPKENGRILCEPGQDVVMHMNRRTWEHNFGTP